MIQIIEEITNFQTEETKKEVLMKDIKIIMIREVIEAGEEIINMIILNKKNLKIIGNPTHILSLL